MLIINLNKQNYENQDLSNLRVLIVSGDLHAYAVTVYCVRSRQPFLVIHVLNRGYTIPHENFGDHRHYCSASCSSEHCEQETINPSYHVHG